MKKTTLKHIPILLAVAALFWQCERDDICPETTVTTPQLVVEFYDAANPDNLKSVTSFTVYGEDLVTNPTETSNATLVFSSNENKVNMPLKVGTENTPITTKFVLEKDTNLRLDNDTATNSNTDVIAITYTPEFQYVSRACGYKSIFTNLEVQVESDTAVWITSINVKESKVENEDLVHVQIFH